MAKSLIIFVSSPNVGPYVNAITHSIVEYSVDRIVLVNLLQTPLIPQFDFKIFANEDLWKTLSSLSEGRYVRKERYVGHSFFFFKEQASFNFMAAVTICSDFGAPQNKVCHCSLFPRLFAMK